MVLKQQDPNLWFEDRELIILLAEDGTGYKIHKVFLEKGSMFFKRLLSDPGLVLAERVGDTRVIRMTDDHPSDVRVFANALYTNPYVHIQYTVSITCT